MLTLQAINSSHGAMRSLFVPILVGLTVFLLSCEATTTSRSIEVDSTASTKPAKYYVPPASETGTSGEIYIAVDESLRPIIEAQIENFQQLYRKATIHPVYLPGEAAIQALVNADSFRLAVSTRQLSDEEVMPLAARSISPNYAHILTDGIGVLVHTKNPVKELSRAHLMEILTGKITRWQQLDTQTRLKDIQIVFDHPQSSTLRFLKDNLLQGDPLTQQNIYALKSNPEVLDYVKTHPEALGFVGMSWISDRDDPEVRDFLSGLSVLKIEKPDEDVPCAYTERFFGPYQSFLDQQCYPLGRKVYTILRESSFGLGTGFVSYLDGPVGQRLVHKSGLAASHSIPRVIKLPPKPKRETLNNATE